MQSNSGRSHKIVQVNTLHDLDGILVIEIFEFKVVYTIYPRVFLSRNYGSYFTNLHPISNIRLQVLSGRQCHRNENLR